MTPDTMVLSILSENNGKVTVDKLIRELQSRSHNGFKQGNHQPSSMRRMRQIFARDELLGFQDGITLVDGITPK